MTKEGEDENGRKDGKDRKVRRVRSPVAFSVARALLCLVILPVSVLPAQSLAKRLDARLDRPPFNRQLWGVAVADENGKLIYSRNADRLFIPASNTKLVVTAVASALLPGDWRVKTSVYGGPVVGGVLLG